MLSLTLSSGDAILLIVAIALPLGLISFLGAGDALKQIGKGPFSIEQEMPQSRGGTVRKVTAAEREAEIRQFLEARAYRQEARGQEPVDVDAEVKRLLAADQGTTSSLTADAQLVSEVRELVIASNDRRQRMGKEPLDVDAEVQRQLAELESLGQ
ncbi:MAG: hypothetical protein M3383_04690 [Actinomycetota bacterium]|nr:hypothetical protein [Actinomycetota bacterium]